MRFGDLFDSYLTASRWAQSARHNAKHHPTAIGGNVHLWTATALYWEGEAERLWALITA